MNNLKCTLVLQSTSKRKEGIIFIWHIDFQDKNRLIKIRSHKNIEMTLKDLKKKIR